MSRAPCRSLTDTVIPEGGEDAVVEVARGDDRLTGEHRDQDVVALNQGTLGYGREHEGYCSTVEHSVKLK